MAGGVRRLLVLALALAMIACGAQPNQPTQDNTGANPPSEQPSQSEGTLEELAKAEGTVTWYTTGSIEAATAVAEEFTAATGIRVEIFRQTAGPLTETFYADVARNDIKADVISHSEPSTLLTMGEEGLIERVEPKDAAKFPSEPVTAMAGYGYPDRWLFYVIVYNADRMTQDEVAFLESDPWNAITDPRFKGEITLPDPNVNGGSFNNFYLLGEWMGGGDRQAAQDWYARLAANEPVFFNSNGPAADAVASGEVKIGILSESFSAALIQQGAPLVEIYPSPIMANYGATGVVAGAPHPNAARLFFDWFLSAEGQSAWNRHYAVAVPHADVEDARSYLTEKAWYRPPTEFYYAEDLKQQDAERTPFLEQFNRIFGL